MDAGESLESKINRSEYKILIVDDVVSNVLLLKILLTNEKFQVCTANNGNMCIEMAKKEHPDLILLDVMMPDISGFDTAVILKKDEETKDIPIIFLTALNTPTDLVHGFQVGASDFLTKPFNKEELVMRVTQQISLVAAKRIIEHQNEELRATLNNRDKMYSVIAHDLRSPMASIRMVLNLVVASTTPELVGPELYELLDKANRESEEVHDLLDNLLKWTKSQTGRLNVVEQDLDLNDIIPGVVDIFEIIAQTKRIKLNLQGSDTHLVVRADNDMLKTVVRNFISNAIKFSPEDSSIDIVVRQEGDYAKVSVRDHGVGIAANRLDSIFRKGETTYGTGGEEGSGLGLLLCQDFAQKNGGMCTVESVEGQGSTFNVLIPLKKE
ncbi:two-component system, unclassified family, sensor histidine kinase and response regulator [Prevotella aff. ruminicola Tc2-24]|jgi:two-component system sensor histidine kinase/response regulator|uniref:histidine kinase n=1 Tax=Prevotella aff. ruminicola Tc2-24 TaxID=81582 RepID=A0A1I0M1U2_9BACT|nr:MULTISPECIES: hybrid sensor histidine kinase/response regulator [Prevotella]SEE02058.1 two-component system, unclassified family, sensor histidine kinase and response regulator [Prevotella sp. lc2012]SEV82118.1 two-component system, unclassified family, sensor histidine kinase and response regulator [Prevotella aff. ruminicola Tc2-24]